MAASADHVISKEVKTTSLDTIEFLDPHWQNSGIKIILYKYDTVISDALVGSFMDVLFLLLSVILLELHEKPNRKDWLTEKKCIEQFLWGISLFDYMFSFLCHFLLLSSSISSPSQVTYLLIGPYKNKWYYDGWCSVW